MPARAIGPLSRNCFQTMAVVADCRGADSQSARVVWRAAVWRERTSGVFTFPKRRTYDRRRSEYVVAAAMYPNAIEIAGLASAILLARNVPPGSVEIAA